jgi:hypothetical protein
MAAPTYPFQRNGSLNIDRMDNVADFSTSISTTELMGPTSPPGSPSAMANGGSERRPSTDLDETSRGRSSSAKGRTPSPRVTLTLKTGGRSRDLMRSSDASRKSDDPTRKSRMSFRSPDGGGNLNTQVKHMKKQLSKQKSSANRKGKGLINPDDSSLMRWWDGATTLALVYTAAVTPVEIAFFPSDSPGWNMTPEEL